MGKAYAGATVIMPTKHAKSLATGPAFAEHLGASVLEFVIDTDTFGTFTRERPRTGSALEAARLKCELGLQLAGSHAVYGLASEGSFGPHPALPFLAADCEILYFIDRQRGFHLHMSELSEATNYLQRAITSLDELAEFARTAQFPSHALILRPEGSLEPDLLFKGLSDPAALRQAFETCRKARPGSRIWVETDMRASFNPSRMAVIATLARKLARRLATECPSCKSPGWGIVKSEPGLPCAYCSEPTAMTAREISGCVLCNHQEQSPRSDGLTHAPQGQCQNCNP
jgi:hypothetical protein